VKLPRWKSFTTYN